MTIEMLVTHVMTAIATAYLFLFQMAKLNASMSAWFGKDELARMGGDIHASNNQEGSADKAHVANGLDNTTESLPLRVQKITHNLEYGQGLRTVTSQGTRNRCGEARRWDALPTWQFIGVAALKLTRLRITEIRRAARASE